MPLADDAAYFATIAFLYAYAAAERYATRATAKICCFAMAIALLRFAAFHMPPLPAAADAAITCHAAHIHAMIIAAIRHMLRASLLDVIAMLTFFDAAVSPYAA